MLPKTKAGMVSVHHNEADKLTEAPYIWTFAKTMSLDPTFSTGTLAPTGDNYIVGFGSKAILEVPERNTLADIRSVKYSHHLKGDRRKGGDAEADEQTRITILIKGGPWKQDMWITRHHVDTVILKNAGDYITWTPGYWHTWEALGDATMLTVSFERRNEEEK